MEAFGDWETGGAGGSSAAHPVCAKAHVSTPNAEKTGSSRCPGRLVVSQLIGGSRVGDTKLMRDLHRNDGDVGVGTERSAGAPF